MTVNVLLLQKYCGVFLPNVKYVQIALLGEETRQAHLYHTTLNQFSLKKNFF